MIGYLDTSAALKLVISEPETKALSGYLQHEARTSDLSVVAAWLLHAELHCAANRRPESVDSTQVRSVLDVIDLIDVERADLIAAGSSPRRGTAAGGPQLRASGGGSVVAAERRSQRHGRWMTGAIERHSTRRGLLTGLDQA